jgi:anti-anti-sigma factor
MTVLEDCLQVHGVRVDDVTVFVVRGDLDATAARALRPMIDGLGPDDHVLVDCVDVGFVDGSGLAVLRELAARNVAAGGPLHVWASDQVWRHIAAAGLQQLFAFD